MSDSNSVSLAAIKESSYNEVITGNPPLTEIPLISESLEQTTNSSTSATLRSDRQRSDVVRTGVQTGGDLKFALRYGDYDNFMASSLMGNAWSTAAAIMTANSTIQATLAGTVFTLGIGVWATTPTAGMWIEVRGFAAAGDNGYFKVVSATTTTIVVENGAGMTNEAAGNAITIMQGAQIVNGTTLDSWHFERGYTDLSSKFAQFGGLSFNSFALEIAADTEITGTFGMIGALEASATATLGDGSNVAASSNQEMNSIDHIPGLLQGGAVLDLLKIDFNLNNNLRARNIIGNLGAQSMGSGSIDLTGNLQAYFTDHTLMDLYLNWTSTSLAVISEDDAGNAYILDFPNVKLSAGKRPATGLNVDVIADMQFVAYRDGTEDVTFRIVRFPAA